MLPIRRGGRVRKHSDRLVLRRPAIMQSIGMNGESLIQKQKMRGVQKAGYILPISQCLPGGTRRLAGGCGGDSRGTSTILRIDGRLIKPFREPRRWSV